MTEERFACDLSLLGEKDQRSRGMADADAVAPLCQGSSTSSVFLFIPISPTRKRIKRINKKTELVVVVKLTRLMTNSV